MNAFSAPHMEHANTKLCMWEATYITTPPCMELRLHIIGHATSMQVKRLKGFSLGYEYIHMSACMSFQAPQASPPQYVRIDDGCSK